MDLRHEVLQRVAGEIFGPRSCDKQRPQDFIGLLRVQIAKRFLETVFRLVLNAVETGLVELLAISRRYADQEIEELRRLRLKRAGIIFQRRHKNAAQFSKRRKLSRREVMRGSLACQIDRGNFQLWNLRRLPGNLASGSIRLRNWLLLRSGLRRNGLPGSGNSGDNRRDEQALNKFPTFHLVRVQHYFTNGFSCGFCIMEECCARLKFVPP
jgi:hypothetical protein